MKNRHKGLFLLDGRERQDLFLPLAKALKKSIKREKEDNSLYRGLSSF